ncbi:hypothetical protein HWV62_30745 [Athelia sp. TMB]|nr:hypothetical protein HWV62_15112 [Athelia sp. TMB]KAF7981952.1 hypothetical protein HWV62_30745 [Athelia sp. TMB]
MPPGLDMHAGIAPVLVPLSGFSCLRSAFLILRRKGAAENNGSAAPSSEPKPLSSLNPLNLTDMKRAVSKGDQLLIVFPDQENEMVHIEWQQDMSTCGADYYHLVADNITTGRQQSLFLIYKTEGMISIGDVVPVFIAAEFYENRSTRNPKHISRVGAKRADEGYEFTIDSNFQYGQKNASGELRFVVYHDKNRKQFQHRFIETALGSVSLAKALEIAASFWVS